MLDTLDAGRETLADFTAEWWEIYAKPNLELATLGYVSLLNAHVLPRLGQRRRFGATDSLPAVTTERSLYSRIEQRWENDRKTL